MDCACMQTANLSCDYTAENSKCGFFRIYADAPPTPRQRHNCTPAVLFGSGKASKPGQGCAFRTNLQNQTPVSNFHDRISVSSHHLNRISKCLSGMAPILVACANTCFWRIIQVLFTQKNRQHVFPRTDCRRWPGGAGKRTDTGNCRYRSDGFRAQHHRTRRPSCFYFPSAYAGHAGALWPD